MKSLTTGTVSNRGQVIIGRSWRHDQKIRTVDTCDKNILLEKMDSSSQAISLPLNHWESFIVFLAESFALAESEQSVKRGESKRCEIGITLTVDRKTS